MHPKAICRRHPLVGLSFSVSELVTAVAWAERHGLALSVLLDRVIDEAEYEEMLVLEGRPQNFAQHVLWRTNTAVFEQHAGAPPRAFRSLHGALRSLVPLGTAKTQSLSAARSLAAALMPWFSSPVA